MYTTEPATAHGAAAYPHRCYHGFCEICGGVWPCARAERERVAASLPVPRLGAIDALLP